ncbi:AAA+ ATPase domain [Artemisia annua]|uniref:AAA+ ATPase domain n=1 Tax=Artemisia annua TaxID=35608 RepID=A0A2U1NVB5_ARTAN|nr:AAA+ ATPase domain [Artemisia annua]
MNPQTIMAQFFFIKKPHYSSLNSVTFKILSILPPNISGYKNISMEVPDGYLVYGPQRTGKTTLVHALAKQSELSFFPVYATDIAKIGKQGIERLFVEARISSPSIVLIENVECIAAKQETGETDPILKEVVIGLSGLAGSDLKLQEESNYARLIQSITSPNVNAKTLITGNDIQIQYATYATLMTYATLILMDSFIRHAMKFLRNSPEVEVIVGPLKDSMAAVDKVAPKWVSGVASIVLISASVFGCDWAKCVGRLNDLQSDYNWVKRALRIEMDNCKTYGKEVVVIATTDKREKLDPFMTQAGWFSDQVHVPTPDEDDRRKMVKYLLKDFLREEDKQVCNLIVFNTKGLVWGNIKHICRLVYGFATKRGNTHVTVEDVQQAFEQLKGNVNSEYGQLGEDLQGANEAMEFE